MRSNNQKSFGSIKDKEINNFNNIPTKLVNMPIKDDKLMQINEKNNKLRKNISTNISNNMTQPKNYNTNHNRSKSDISQENIEGYSPSKQNSLIYRTQQYNLFLKY